MSTLSEDGLVDGPPRAQLVDDLIETVPVRWVDRLDHRVDQWWADTFRGKPALDRAYYLASELADFSLIWQLVGAAQGLRSDPRDPEASLRMGTTLLVESLIVNQGIKRLFKRPRPVAVAARPHHLRTPSTSSFPSGHASAAFTAAGVLSQRDPRLAPAFYAAAAFVATSRLHVKIHHASDVVAGAALGVVFAKVATRVWPLPARGWAAPAPVGSLRCRTTATIRSR